MYFFGTFDANRDDLWSLPHKRQTRGEVLDFFMLLRQRFPQDQRLYIVLDNCSAHTTPAILEWVRRNRVTLVLTPTCGSFLNRIECQFTPFKKFALSGCCHRKMPPSSRSSFPTCSTAINKRSNPHLDTATSKPTFVETALVSTRRAVQVS